MRLDELAVVVAARAPDPRIEELHRLRARLDLGPQVVADDVGELADQRVPGPGLAVHEALGEGECFGWPPSIR